MPNRIPTSPTDLAFQRSYGNWEMLMQTGSLALQKMGGAPVRFPYVVPEAGQYNLYGNFNDILTTEAVARSFGQTKQANSQSQVATISMITARMMATFGWNLTPQQITAIQSAAELIGTYGPMYIGMAKQILQAGGLDDENKEGSSGSIELALGVAEKILDASYGEAGSRLPFFSATKASIANLVETDAQDALLSEVMHRLFPVDVDVQKIGGLNGKAIGDIVHHLHSMGISPLNTNAYSTQELLRENAVREYRAQQAPGRTGTTLATVNRPEQNRLVEEIANQRRDELFRKGSRAEVRRSIIQEQIDAVQQKNPNLSASVVTNYVSQLEQTDRIMSALKSAGIESRGQLTNQDSEKRADILLEIQNRQQALIEEKNKLPTGDEGNARRVELTQKINQLSLLNNQVERYSNAVKEYTQGGGTAMPDMSAEIERRQREILTRTLNENKQIKSLPGFDVNTYVNARVLQDSLNRMPEIIKDLPKLESEDERVRMTALNNYLEDPNVRQDVKDNLRALYGEKKYTLANGTQGTLRQYQQEKDKLLGESYVTAASEDAYKVIGEYGRLMESGQTEEAKAYRDRNIGVISRWEAMIASRGAEDVYGAEARSLSRFSNAIRATGGATLNGKPIRDMNDIENIMDMMTQMTGRYQLNDKDWEDHWSTIAYGMSKTGMDADWLLQISKHSADAAEQRGGNRGMAAMAATRLALATNQSLRNANLNLHQASTVIAQAAGAGSTNTVARAVNALSWELQDVTDRALEDNKNLTEMDRNVIRKIRQRRSLSKQEREYLDENAHNIMNRLGISADKQSLLMNKDMYGSRGLFAITEGAAAEMDNRVLRNIRYATIGKGLEQQLGVDSKTSSIVSDMAYDIAMRNEKALQDPKILKTQLLAQIKGKVPEEVYKKLERMPAKDLALFTESAIGQGADTYFNGVTEALRSAYIASSDADASNEMYNAARAAEVLPSNNGDMITNLMSVLGNENSTIEDIIATVVGGGGKPIEKSQIDTVSAGIATVALLEGNRSVFRDVKDLTKFNKARESINTILNSGVGAKELNEVMSNRYKMLKTFESRELSESKLKLLDEYAGASDARKAEIHNLLVNDKTGGSISEEEFKSWTANQARYNEYTKPLSASDRANLESVERAGADTVRTTISRMPASNGEAAPLLTNDVPQQQQQPATPQENAPAATPASAPNAPATVPARAEQPATAPAPATGAQASRETMPIRYTDFFDFRMRKGQSTGDYLYVYVVNGEKGTSVPLPTTTTPTSGTAQS